MQPSSGYAKRWLGLDRRVVLTLLLTSAASAGLLSYRLTTEAPCREIPIAMSSLTNHTSHNFFTNELVHFSAPLQGEGKIEWDFGDQTARVEGAHVTHMFRQPGDYTIRVFLNNRCSSSEILTIKAYSPAATNQPGDTTVSDVVRELANPIEAESFVIEQGRQLLFSSNVKASSYQWSIENDKAQPVRNTDKAAYSFLSTGNFIIKLELNGDPANTWTRVVTVTPRRAVELPPLPGTDAVAGGGGSVPPPLPPPLVRNDPKPSEVETTRPPTTTDKEDKSQSSAAKKPDVVEVYMDNEQWKEMLQDVVRGDASLADFKLYLSDVQAKIVLLDKETISFAELLSRLKDKRVDEKSIQVDQDYDFPTKRLRKLIVKYRRKRGLF